MRLASLHTYPVKGCHRQDHDRADVWPWGLAADRRWMILDTDRVAVTQREARALVAVRPRTRPGALVLTASGRTDLAVVEPQIGEEFGARVFRHRAPVPVRAADATADKWLSELLDRPARLVWLPDPTVHPIPDPDVRQPGDAVSFADAYPLLLTNAASLDALNDALVESASREGPLPMTRFRPNVVVADAPRWAEDGWLGRRLRIGAVTFRVAKPCDRCVVTTVDQESGGAGREPLRVLAAHRRVNQELLFGVYLIPERPSGSASSGSIAGGPASPGPAPLGGIAVGDAVELLS